MNNELTVKIDSNDIATAMEHDSTTGLILRAGSAPQVFVFEGQHYTVGNANDFIALVKKYACMDRCVVACSDDGAKAILDVGVQDRVQDTVTLQFLNSTQMKEFGSAFLSCLLLTQKEFLEFLDLRFVDDLPQLDNLRYAVKNFKFVKNITGDFSREDDDNYTFVFKSADGEGSAKLPKEITALIEIIKDSGLVQEIKFKLEVKKPQNEKEQLMFVLSCPCYKRYLEIARREELKKLREGLSEATVVSGSI